MRLLHIIAGLNVGGAERFLLKLLARLPPRIETSVISLSNVGVVGQEMRALGIDVSALGMTRRTPAPVPILQLRNKIKAMHPDIVQTWMYHADLIGGLAALWARAPAIVWSIRHGDPSLKSNRWSTAAIARICAALSTQLPTRIICCAERAREAHVRFGYSNNKMIVLPNGFDLSHYDPTEQSCSAIRHDLGIHADNPVVGLVGRFNPLKGHRTLIEAATLLRKRWPDIRYILAGKDLDDNNRTLTRWLREFGLNSSFVLLGARDDVPRLLAGIDVLVAPSLSEAFPNVVGEAMANAVPCIVSDVGDAALLVGDTGLVIPSENAHALAVAIEQILLLSKPARRALGNRARSRIQDNYEISVVTRQYTEFYELLNQTRSFQSTRTR